MASSPSPLHDFVTRMQNEPDLQQQYATDPTGTMTAAGLSSEDQNVVQSGDLNQLNAAVQQQGGSPVHDMDWLIIPSDAGPDSTGA